MKDSFTLRPHPWFSCLYPRWAVLLLALLAAVGCQTSPETGKSSQQLPGIVRKDDPDFSWYSKYVTIESPSIKMAKNFAGNRMVIFAGVVNNGGEKALDLVEVELILFNFEDPVHREVRVPITPASRHTPPLEPLSSRAFTLYMDDFPKEWRASSAEMAIHGFRFRKEE